MAKFAYFVTGTDTEIGKTHCACALLHAGRRAGLGAVGMKPVAAGTDERGRNDDVERLIAASTVVAPREEVNPYLFAPPIAPHLAAREAGVVIEPALIRARFDALGQRADLVVVEGVGGFRVPLGENHDTADLAQTLGIPVILVVGIRLGCINHALLTAEAILQRGLPLAGWIANQVDPRMARPEANIQTLLAALPAPLLGEIPFAPAASSSELGTWVRLPQ